MNLVLKIKAILTSSEQKSAILLLGLMIVGMLLEMLGIGLIIPVVTLLMNRDFANSLPISEQLLSFFNNPSQTQMVFTGMLLLVLVYLIKNIFLAFLAWRQTRFAFDVQAALSQRLYASYIYQPYIFHLKRNSAELVRNTVNEVNLFTVRALIPGMVLLTEVLVICGIGGLLFYVEPFGAAAVLIVISSTAWIFHKGTRGYLNKWGTDRQLHEGLRLQHLQQGLGGIKDIKILGCERTFLQQYKKHNVGSAKAAGNQLTLQQMPRLSLEFIAVIGLMILVVSMISQGKNTTDVLPVLGVFAVAAFRLIPSLNRMLTSVQALRFTIPVVNTLYEEFKPNEQRTFGNSDSRSLAFDRCLEIKGLVFNYPSVTNAAVKDITLSIKKDEIVGFIGASGSGKSTLVDLILGLYEPKSGSISVDGNDIQKSLAGWQQQIGYVPQIIYLTDDTLRRNVAFGKLDAEIDDEAVIRAIHLAQLDEFVSTLSEGLETLVGERGVRLSGGQRQRIGIARALYHNPAVLVLDEATSALDNETEKSVMKAIESLQRQKTIIIIAHRLSTLDSCDYIYQLSDGQIVNHGAPSVMLNSALEQTVNGA